MFTIKDKKKYDDAMDSIENMGECIGIKIHKGGSWVIKTVVMGSLVILIGSLVFIASIARKTVSRK